MIGYISDNVLLPILDFFYGLVPSYGLAIIALTVVIRLALFPLSAGSIRNARRMRIAQPVMQQRQAEIRSKFANNPSKQQEEMGKYLQRVQKEAGKYNVGLIFRRGGGSWGDEEYRYEEKIVGTRSLSVEPAGMLL